MSSSSASSASNFNAWLQNVPVIYDFLYEQTCDIPSTIVQWGATHTTDRGKVVSELFYSEWMGEDAYEDSALKLAAVTIHPSESLECLESLKEFIGGHVGLKQKKKTAASKNIEQKKTIYCSAKGLSQARRLTLDANSSTYLLATVGGNDTIAVWDMGRLPDMGRDEQSVGPTIALRRKDVSFYSLDASAGQIVATGTGGVVPLFANLATGAQPVQEFITKDQSVLRDVALDAETQLVVAAGDSGIVYVWDKRTRTAAGPSLQFSIAGEGGAPRPVLVCSPQGEFVATGEARTGAVKVWKMNAPRQPVMEFNAHDRDVTALEWSPHDGDHLVSAGRDGRVLFFHTGEPDAVFQHVGHQESEILDFAFHPTEQHVLASVAKKPGGRGSLQVWRVPSLIFANSDGELEDNREDDDME